MKLNQQQWQEVWSLSSITLSLMSLSLLTSSSVNRNVILKDKEQAVNKLWTCNPLVFIGMRFQYQRHFHKHNLRHLPRFPDFFVTFRILSPLVWISGRKKWCWNFLAIFCLYFMVTDLNINSLASCAWRLHPKTKKARKGNVGTSVEWRLNSENDSRIHGQPSLA